MIPKEVTLHQHDMSNFLSCPFKYKLAVVHNVVPKTYGRALNIGTVFSKSVYELHKTGQVGPAMQLVSDYKESLVNVTRQEQQDDIDNDICMVQAMILGYFKHFMKERKVAMPIINNIEPEFRIEISFYNGIKYKYVMRLDGRITDSARYYWILELKTSSGVSADLLLELPTNFQINSYNLGMKELFITPTLGVLYRFITKAQIRQKKTESLEQFRQRILLEYNDNPEKYFFEESLYFDRNATERFKKDLEYHFRYMTFCYIHDYFPKNGNSCITKYGSHCDYLKYCSNPTQETVDSYYRINNNTDNNINDNNTKEG
jgi:hypothetical protein